MEKSHLLGEFLVKNKVITADQLLIAIEDQRGQAHELGLLEHMKEYLNEEEIQIVLMRQVEKHETFETAIKELGYLSEEQLNALPINEKAYRTPLGQVLLKFNFVSQTDLERWLDHFENQDLEDDYEQIKLLGAVPVFSNLSQAVLKEIVPLMKYRYYRAGETIFKEGFESDHVYMIESGLVRLSVPSAGGEMELDSMQSGYSFGLPGVLSQRPRMERAVAIMNTRIWSMTRDDVHQVLVQNPESALIAAKLVSEKIQDMLTSVKEKKTRVHTGNIHLMIFDREAFDEKITGALVDRIQKEARGKTLLIHSMLHRELPAAEANDPRRLDRIEIRSRPGSADGDSFDTLYLPGVEDLYNEGEEIEDLENLSYWINNRTKHYQSLIFLTYPGHIEFRRLMMGVARRTAIFVHKEIPEFVRYSRTGRDRVYLMDNQSHAEVFANFNKLKKLCPVTLAANTFQTAPEKLERSCGQIARYLVGKTIGIAFGGGGARGCAHVGVLQVLTEQGIEFDAVAGPSAGAVAGAFLAHGYSPEEIHSYFEEHVMHKKPFSDWTIPIVSFIRGKRGTRIMKKALGTRLSYDTDLAYLPVACDMANGEAVILKGVPLWKACMASGAAPGLMPPVMYDGKTLLDGGIVDNVPAAMLKDFGIDFIISVNISVDLTAIKQLPRHAFSIIMRSIDIMGDHTVTRHLDYTNVNVEPEVSEWSIFDWEHGTDILKRGREAMERKIPELRFQLKKLYSS